MRLPFRVAPPHDRFRARASRLSCLAPPKQLRLSATCASQQRASPARAPLSNVRLSARPLTWPSSQLSSSSSALVRFSSFHVPPKHSTLSAAPPPKYSHTRASQVLHTQTLLSSVFHPPRPALFWTRCIHTRQSEEDTPPLPLPFLASDFEGDDDPLVGRSARAFWREISPRPCLASIRPSESVTTRCSFDGECR